jgi:hypothetical protein
MGTEAGTENFFLFRPNLFIKKTLFSYKDTNCDKRPNNISL